MEMDDLLKGWTIKPFKNGEIVVQASDGSGVVVCDDDESSIAAVILHRLAKDISERAGVQPARAEPGGVSVGITPAQADPDAGLIAFEDLPLGGRFKYPGCDRVWTVLSKWREPEDGQLNGAIAEWRPDMMSLGHWPGQSICEHIAGDPDCPEMVIPVD